jgi:hypothetical protein
VPSLIANKRWKCWSRRARPHVGLLGFQVFLDDAAETVLVLVTALAAVGLRE